MYSLNVRYINQLKPATFLCLSTARTWIFNAICHDIFCVQLFESKGDCFFCWYWCNCWPSLFKLSFIMYIQMIHVFLLLLPNTDHLQPVHYTRKVALKQSSCHSIIIWLVCFSYMYVIRYWSMKEWWVI